jgi:hypothetical protein
MSETTTFAPSLRNRSAQALPIPRAAPVMTATLPDSFMHLAPEWLAIGQAGHQLGPPREANMSTEPIFEKDDMCGLTVERFAAEL